MSGWMIFAVTSVFSCMMHELPHLGNWFWRVVLPRETGRVFVFCCGRTGPLPEWDIYPHTRKKTTGDRVDEAVVRVAFFDWRDGPTDVARRP